MRTQVQLPMFCRTPLVGAAGARLLHSFPFLFCRDFAPQVKTIDILSDALGNPAAIIFFEGGQQLGSQRLPSIPCASTSFTPCGTRTRHLQVRSPTPCPLGQGRHVNEHDPPVLQGSLDTHRLWTLHKVHGAALRMLMSEAHGLNK